MPQRIYLDHNATTPIDLSVLEVVLEGLKQIGNPSSIHTDGKIARKHLEASREAIANYLRVRPDEIIFTSGGTEGAYLLLHGVMNGASQGHIITSLSEHACVEKTIETLSEKKHTVTSLSTGTWGSLRREEIERALRSDTRLICVMAANNETGVLTDLADIASLAHKKKIPFLVDGVALLGKEHFEIPEGVSGMFFSGHKIHAPRGVGFCFCRRHFNCLPTFVGGHQEFNRRAGTENLSGIMGMAKAVALIQEEGIASISSRMRNLRDYFEKILLEELGEIIINGEGPRVSNTSNLSFLGIEGELLLMSLNSAGISISHGSACSSGALEPSKVLVQMGLPASRTTSAIRISLARTTTQAEVDHALRALIDVVRLLRAC